MKHRIYLVFFGILLFCSSHEKVIAQGGFGGEINLGPVLADGKMYHDTHLQANLFYFVKISEQFSVGLNTGGILLVGSGSSTGAFSEIPTFFIPLAGSIRANVIRAVRLGIDLGGAFDVVEGGGFYVRPLIGYKIKEKLSINVSYSSIFEKDSFADENFRYSSICLGFDFQF